MILEIRKDFNLYLGILLIFLLSFFLNFNSIHIEYIDLNIIGRILKPDSPKGEIIYDPGFNYNYFIAYISKFLSEEFKFENLAKILWLIEQMAAIFVLAKISNYLFNSDKIVLVTTIFSYLMLKSGEVDQKTFLTFFYFLSFYFLITKQFKLSAIFSGLMFFFHIGIALWWFLPSTIALFIIKLTNTKTINFKNILIYIFVTIIIASPVILFYFNNLQNENLRSTIYLSQLFYGINNSIIYLFTNDHSELIRICISFILATTIYKFYKKDVKNSEYLIYIILGVLLLYIVNSIPVDIFFNGTVMKLQLLRSIINIDLLVILGASFFLAKKIRSGSYVFLIIFLICYTPIFLQFLNLFSPKIQQWHLQYFFYLVITINLFYLYIYKKKLIKKNTIISQSKYYTILLLFILSAQVILNFKPIKSYLKNNLISSYSKEDYKESGEINDIVNYANLNLDNYSSIIVYPFNEPDWGLFLNHITFIDKTTAFHRFYNLRFFDHFEEIVKKDLNYTSKELRKNGIWKKMWTNIDEITVNNWKKKYKITHMIREKKNPLNFTVMYENNLYQIYDLRK